MNSKCNGCNSEIFQTICTRSDGLDIVRCKQCGLEFVNPIPDNDLLEKIYKKEMLEETTADAYYEQYIKERKNRSKSYERVAHKRLELIEKQKGEKGKLLDIGCGAGFFMKTASSRGWDVAGIELLPEYIEFAKNELGLTQVYGKPLESLNLPDNSFDVVTLWDLIEHLQNPAETLNEIHRVLRPEGIIVIWTPNSLNAAYMKEKWMGYTILTHLYFFSVAPLKSMLSHVGFSTIFIQTNKSRKGMFQSIIPEPYKAPEDNPSKLQKRLRGLKRDIRNMLRPETYVSPILDKLGYGFNIFMIAQKK